MFKKLAKQLKATRTDAGCFPMTSPADDLKDETKKSFLKGLSRHALNLYERKTDITNFTKLALSNPENNSHNEIVDELFSNADIKYPFSDDALFALTENQQFLKDLGL